MEKSEHNSDTPPLIPKVNRRERFFTVAVPLFFICIVLFYGSKSALALYYGKTDYCWEKVPAEILSSKVVFVQSRHAYYKVVVVFRYFVDGSWRVGEKYQAGSGGEEPNLRKDMLESEIALLPAKTVAFVHPYNREIAFLKTGVRSNEYFNFFRFLSYFVLGLFVLTLSLMSTLYNPKPAIPEVNLKNAIRNKRKKQSQQNRRNLK